MTESRREFESMRRKVRHYRRQAKISSLAFLIAVGLLAFAVFQNVSYREALSTTTQAMEAQRSEHEDAESMIHYIKTLQGRLNSCRVRGGDDPLTFEKY